MRQFFFIIVAATIFCCSGGSKSDSNRNELEVAEISDTLVIPEDAVPIVYRRQIYIPSEVDSIFGNFLFDTGADGLYFDDFFYANNSFREFKLSYGTIGGIGTGKPQQIRIITDTVSFKFKNYSNNLDFIAIMSLKPMLGDFVDGILGKKYFANNILEINYFHEYIRLHNDFNTIDTTDYVKIGMKSERNRLFVPATIQIDDEISIQDYLILDIGSGGDISITSPFANKFKLIEKINNKIPYYTKYGGVGGQSSSYDFRAHSIEIGNFKLDSVTMDFSIDKSGALSRDDHAGLLGNRILERFNVIIDFINDNLYLKPNQNYDKPFNFSKLGFGYVDRGTTMDAWIVTGLYKGSNAEVAGLKIDDKIISVNGIDIHEIPFLEQSEFWREIDNVLLAVLRNGKEIKIEFELKPVL